MPQPVILAVDDDATVLRSVARDLRTRYGGDYRILRASSGAEALEALDELVRRRQAVALVLSDQRMPQMDGVTLLREAGDRFPSVRRVLLTAYADTDAAIEAINHSQVDYYLLKPWDPPEEKLYPVLDDLLDDWRAGYRPGFGGVRVVGDRWSARSFELKDFLARNHVPYEFIDVADGDGDWLRRAGLEERPTDDLPVVVTPEGRLLASPSSAEVAEAVGLQTHAAEAFYDLVIVGGGPAGLASAVYGASEGLRTVLVEQHAPGGQAGTSSRIENYLGFPSGLSGADLARRAVTQARRFGVEILAPREARALTVQGPYRHLDLSDGTTLTCHALMLSMGVDWRRLPAEGAEALTGRGVYYGAANTEAARCREEDVFIVGAGNSAGQAALNLADYARRVVMVVRGDALGAKMSHYLVDRITQHPRIDVRLDTEVVACEGDDNLERLVLETADGERVVEATNYLFVFIGAVPHTDWLGEAVARDGHGFILTGADLRDEHLRGWPLERAPFLLEASVPGVFAAGDVRHESVKRVASAVGEGSVAVHFVHRHLAGL